MKKYITSGLVLAGLVLGINAPTFAAAKDSRTIKADIQAIRIPAGTTMNLEIMDAVSSKVGSVGDEFSAMLKEDKMVSGQIALPAGSMIRGTINKMVPSKRISRSAIVYLTFDHVVTPTGRQIPLSAGLYNYGEITLDGGIYQGGNYGYAIKQNWANTKKIVSNTVEWGKGTGNNLQYLCVPVGAVGGVLGGALYYVGDDIADLFKKGNSVTIPQGKEISIMLTQPLDIPLH